MYVERIIFSNRAPFESLDLTFEDKSINVLTAINGKGKTTILSYIMDAWVELTRGVYTNSYKGKEESYYRVSSPLYLLDKSKASLVYIRFAENGKNLDYLDIRGSITAEDYDRIVTLDGKIDYQTFGNSNNEIGNKCISPSPSEEIREWFDHNIHTYFPEYRQELPHYLNTKYADDIKYDIDAKFTKNLFTPLEVKTDIHDIANWLMDVLLDREVNNETGSKVIPESTVWLNIKNVLQHSLSGKFSDKEIRLGIGRRSDSGARISIVDHSTERTLCPSIFTLSSGEMAVLSIFCELLRQGDVLFIGKNTSAFHGVVLIDEVEKNLHIKLQKEVLPQLLQLFPNIQFILTSHSPFLNMGLAEIAQERSTIIDLDHNGIVSSPETTQLYNEVFEMMLHEKNTFAEAYSRLKTQLLSIQKPLIITEGKTDIKHIRKAFDVLGIEQRFEVLPEDKQPDGYSDVKDIIENLKKVTLAKKVIAIFDRDVPSLLKSYPDPYKDLGNNVYALCIPCPVSRIKQGRTSISIEYLYSDDEIHAKLPNGTHLFFGSEFNTDSPKRHLLDVSLRATDRKGLGDDKIIENNGGQAVLDNNDKNYLAKKDEFANAIVKGDITISKESWENFRPLIKIINDIIDK